MTGPDLKAAREVTAQHFENQAALWSEGTPQWAAALRMAREARDGQMDQTAGLKLALAAIRIRQEMETEA